MNTHTMISDIHRNVLISQEATDGQQHSVSTTSRPSMTECGMFIGHLLDSGQVGDLAYHVVQSYFCITSPRRIASLVAEGPLRALVEKLLSMMYVPLLRFAVSTQLFLKC